MNPFFDRDLSWVEFNARVLEEALRPEKPLLERWKFLSIVSANLDEFFMVRVASLKRQLDGTGARGRTARDVLARLLTRVREITDAQYRCLLDEVVPALAGRGLRLLRATDYNADQASAAQDIFRRQILPVLTPVRVDAGGELPFLASLRLHILFSLVQQDGSLEAAPVLALLPIPTSLDRIIRLSQGPGAVEFTVIEDIVLANGEALFPGYRILDAMTFRVTRDADMGVNEERDEDFVEAMAEVLASRQRSFPVRLETAGSSDGLRETLRAKLALEPADVSDQPGPLDLKDLMSLTSLYDREDLMEKSWPPVFPTALEGEESIWETLKKGDLLLHHPYDSFDPVVQMLDQAADDPAVLAIKMTLYRTSGDSTVVKALERAAGAGKQVVVLVELKARFDEERNIGWAEALERAGGIVIYGVVDLKVHAKAMMVVRREAEGIRRYLHLGTGNYNDRTARLYTDYSLLSAREELAYELSLFFNAITGYSSVPDLGRLSMAPLALKPRLLELIRREASRSTADDPGLIIAKMNSLCEADVIRELYAASQAGVRIKLIVRGICTLVPGAEGVSENITVTSIIDRFLEHSRVLVFHNGGATEVFLTSADWMPRNLERRVELMFPVELDDHKRQIMEDLDTLLQDNTQAHRLDEDGRYTRITAGKGQKSIRSQLALYKRAQRRAESARLEPRREFTVRRKPPSAPR